MENRQIDSKKVKQILVGGHVHRALKIEAAKEKTTIRALVELALHETFGFETEIVHEPLQRG